MYTTGEGEYDPMTDPYAHVFAEEARIEQLRRRLRIEAEVLVNHTKQRNDTAERCAKIARELFTYDVPETTITRDSGVNRRTVRRWLGKPKS